MSDFTTSSKKIAKKARQIHRKELMKATREVAEQYGKLIKPKPRWVPMWFWVWAIGFFIRIER